ncbi:phosphatidylserine decarboxylase-like protein [Dendrothele bispora CBS 962.96]|uniref:Phosphatidylserine decarboxylase-like protein n=1 Tax=Dendrothele bispora (strain CBS 962.96) TaxID=1314807 RepID=A0A4S8KWR8_DENBC|nr:phosphatidylserine decarboxylase-like protein [Dendrothele bispora CBS 962.96]
MSAKTLRPSPQAFRNAGWLPKSQAAYDKYMGDLCHRIQRTVYSTADAFLPPVQEFKNFIEREPTVYGEFTRMFDKVTESPQNYEELLKMLNEIFREAPAFGDLGPPVYMVMAQVMNSQGGFSAFTKENLNFHFKKMFETWSLYLYSKDSRSVLNTGANGWLSSAAKDAMMKEYPGRTFEQVFICTPGDQFYGYTSYEDFFNRRFKDPATDRPTGDLNNNAIVSNPCESTSYAYQENVQAMDQLFIKDEAYSLHHLLAGNHVKTFIGGTVLQGFLNTTGYHRWHAPVNGTIMKIVDVPGTYFAQGPYTIGEPTDNPDVLPPYLQSLRFFANTAARQLMFIQADDSTIGLVCFISIGMTEISTCQATVYEGQHVVRGDELGMFHFGGSSNALVSVQVPLRRLLFLIRIWAIRFSLPDFALD